MQAAAAAFLQQGRATLALVRDAGIGHRTAQMVQQLDLTVHVERPRARAIFWFLFLFCFESIF